MAILIDWVRESISTTGTGASLTLAGADVGYMEFQEHPDVSNGVTLYCVIANGNGTDWEKGIYTWNTGNTLTRTTIFGKFESGVYTASPGTPLNLDGQAIVVSKEQAEVFKVASLRDVSLSGLTDGELLVSSSGTWINQTLAEAGIELAFTKNTAFNKDFAGSGAATTVSRSDHNHSGTYEPADSTIVKTGQVNTFTRQQVTTSVALTDAANIDWNLDTQPNAKVTLGGNRIMNAPSNIRDGNIVNLAIIQDATGTRTISSWNSAFDFGAEGAPTLTTTASKIDVLSFMTVGTTVLRFLGIKKGFSG